MIRNEAFYMQEIDNCKYLLPVGQMRSDRRHGMLLNSTGEYVWNLLENDISRDEILDNCIKFYEADEKEQEILKQDINDYLDTLIKNSLVIDKFKSTDYLEMINSVTIANIKLSFYGNRNLYPSEMEVFETFDRRMEDVRVEFVNHSLDYCNNRCFLVGNELLQVLEGNDRYILIFPNQTEVFGCQISKDGRLVRIHAHHNISINGKQTVFDALRAAFLYKALLEGYIAIHSSSILYNGKAWLFSAPSGTGKSTHADLWKESFDTKVINGDLNLVSDNDGIPKIYGTPWCGTSQIFDTNEYDLGGIVLLKRSEKDYIEVLSASDKLLKVGQRIISPPWNAYLTAKHYEILKGIINQVEVVTLNCTKNPNAVVIMKQHIDNIQ